MEATKTHWKRLVNPDFLGVYSLEDGKDLDVTILSVNREEIVVTGGKKEFVTVAKIKDNKPFIINKVNAKSISKLLNTPYIEEWVGNTITLFADTTKYAGDFVECLRVRNKLPDKKKEELLPSNEKRWLNAVQALQGGKLIKDIESVYSISEDNRIKLIEDATII